MVKMQTPFVDLGWTLKDFSLLGLDGKSSAIFDYLGENGTIVAFICNHCPYVKEIIDSFAKDAKELQSLGVGVVAVMSNDFSAYPEDSPENMKVFAANHKFTFPYLLDKDQKVAKCYNAVCTPDFFGFNDKRQLQYRGCFINKQTRSHDLLDAMKEVVKNGSTTIKQTPSLGCSIKWKTNSKW